MSGDHDGVAAPETPARLHRPWPGILAVGALALVIALGLTGLTVGLTRGSRPSRKHVAAASTCAAPADGQIAGAPDRIGAWPYHLVEAGVFGSITADGPDSIVALQACGSEETTLRVVKLVESGGSWHVSAARNLERAALLPSSLVDDGYLWVGLARLDLDGQNRTPPYRLTLQQLDPRTLALLSSTDIGRGTTFELDALPDGDLLASTGTRLLRVALHNRAPAITLLASFAGVAQHVTVGSGLAVAGVIRPGAVGPAAAPSLEAISLATGQLESVVHLPSGSDPESLVAMDTMLWAAIGDGSETTLHRYSLPALLALGGPAGRSGSSLSTTLQTIGIDPSASVIWIRGLTVFACADPRSGRIMAETSPPGAAPPYVSQILSVSPRTPALAVTAAGIGVLNAPRACTKG